MYLLLLIEERFPISEQSKRLAINSSGSYISNKLRLFITLRILAGASYLDMVWYEVNVDHVNELVIAMVRKIDDVLHNINIPNAPEDLRLMAEDWSNIQINKTGFHNNILNLISN